MLDPARNARFYQPRDAQGLERELFMDRFLGAALHLPHEILLESDLRQVHPLALLEPVDVARRNLRKHNESGASVVHVSQANRVPCGLVLAVLPRNSLAMLTNTATGPDAPLPGASIPLK